MIDPTEEELLTLPRAARLMGRHPDTVRMWAKSGVLETVRMGKRSYTTAGAVRQMAEGGSRAKVRTPRQKRVAQERAMKKLKERGWA